MSKQKVIATFKPNGEMQIEAQNFKGTDCEKATRFLENALGAVEKRKRKADQQQVKLTQQGGA